jgi:hypothetical protein
MLTPPMRLGWARHTQFLTYEHSCPRAPATVSDDGCGFGCPGVDHRCIAAEPQAAHGLRRLPVRWVEWRSVRRGIATPLCMLKYIPAR